MASPPLFWNDFVYIIFYTSRHPVFYWAVLQPFCIPPWRYVGTSRPLLTMQRQRAMLPPPQHRSLAPLWSWTWYPQESSWSLHPMSRDMDWFSWVFLYLPHFFLNPFPILGSIIFLFLSPLYQGEKGPLSTTFSIPSSPSSQRHKLQMCRLNLYGTVATLCDTW